MNRVPVHVCIGSERESGRRLLARLAAARPGWAVLELQSCPCCAGRAELQVRLARLLREQRPARVLVGYVEPAHEAAFERALAEWPLAQYLTPGRRLQLPEDVNLEARELEAG